MEFIPPESKQQPSLRNKMRGAAYGAIAGLIVGALGSLFLGWGILLAAVLGGGLIGYRMVAGLWPEAPVSW